MGVCVCMGGFVDGCVCVRARMWYIYIYIYSFIASQVIYWACGEHVSIQTCPFT